MARTCKHIIEADNFSSHHFLYIKIMANQHWRDEGRTGVGRSCVMYTFVRMNLKLTTIPKLCQGDDKLMYGD